MYFKTKLLLLHQAKYFKPCVNYKSRIICLDSEFDTLADVNAYAVHPDHVAAAGLLKEVKADRACVDYEL